MAAAISLIPLAIMTLLFSWFYRVAARRILGYPVGWTLIVGFLVLFVIVGSFLAQFLPIEDQVIRLLIGATAQLMIGGYFIGTFAVNKERSRPGFALGLRTTALSMGMQAAVLVALFVLTAFLKTNVALS